MQINELVTFAADVGRGLLESGAETSRVEDTFERIIRHFYDGKSEVLVVMTGLFVTVGDVIKRNWNFFVNRPPKLQSLLGVDR